MRGDGGMRAPLSALGMAVATALCATAPSFGQDTPWRINDALDGPSWLSISGETRLRYGTLNNAFRRGLEGGDQALSARTNILTEVRADAVTLGLEITDSRVYLDDQGSRASTSFVNTADVLQAYLNWNLADRLGSGSQTDVRLGRMTYQLGSNKFISRNGFRNTINTFTGASLKHTRGAWTFNGFYFAPVGRLPDDAIALRDNEQEFDREQTGRRFYAAHLQRTDVANAFDLDLFVYGLDERDTTRVATEDRELYTPGFRAYREPEVSQWDFDLEAAWQFGSRQASTGPLAPTLGVNAQVLHAELGYTFAGTWRPRLSLEYEFASGDDDPNDLRSQRYDRLFGKRRRDFGQTGIHGPLRRENISAPGARLGFAHVNNRLDGRLLYKAAFLASDTDLWRDGRLRDETGGSGDFIGHHLDTRVRYWLRPDNIRFAAGGAILFKGEFARTAPGAPDEGDTTFAYAMVTLTF